MNVAVLACVGALLPPLAWVAGREVLERRAAGKSRALAIKRAKALWLRMETACQRECRSAYPSIAIGGLRGQLMSVGMLGMGATLRNTPPVVGKWTRRANRVARWLNDHGLWEHVR